MRRIAFLFSVAFIIVCSSLKGQTTATKLPKVRINHIAVYVLDLEKSRNFYENVVQLTWIKNPFNDSLHEWFSIGDAVQLHLIKGAKEVTEHVKNSHICFSVPSVDDFIVNLKKHNIAFTNWLGDNNTFNVRVDGVKQLYFKDPDGYWIEVNDNYKE
jgi:lactoylglutathione lyase